jgi:hypothetical protein
MPHDIEKTEAAMQSETAYTPTKGSTDGDFEHDFSPAETKKLIARIDRRLVLTVGVLYCISLMDRTNLSSANIAGYVYRWPLRLLNNGTNERLGCRRS